MEYNVVLHEIFSKEFKSLLKKYPSLKQDVQTIIDNIENELALATDLDDGYKKIRINIKLKGKDRAVVAE
jgi:mRNA-degrading endonuclease YafQ of YafQ-DinJ toxin-antitoxin module